MASPHEKALHKLLKQSGYTPSADNGFGFRTWSRPGHTDVLIMPGTPPRQAAILCDQIRRENGRERRTEETPEVLAKQRLWEASEAERLQREAADAELVRDRRLGGLSAHLTEAEVDAVTRRAERIAADRRATERLMRQRPLAYAN